MTKNEHLPSISVVMSVYNGEDFLKEAVESILQQTYTDFEFIIINDGSTDSSGEILRNYASKDPRIVLIEQENAGLIAALNTGIATAKAELIARMDADDIAHPERFERQKNFMDSHPDIAVLGTDITLIDDKGKTIRNSIYPRHGIKMDDFIYKLGSPVAHPSVIMRKEVVMRIGGYRNAYKHAEDYDLWLRIHKIASLDNINIPLLFYRQHDNKISFKHAYQQSLAAIIARYAAKEEKDPTESIDSITIETIDLFPKEKRAQINLEIMETLLNSTAFMGDETIIKTVIENIGKYKHNACHKTIMRLYLKTGITYKNLGKTKQFINCIGKAFLIAPITFTIFTLSKIVKKSTQRAKRLLRKIIRPLVTEF